MNSLFLRVAVILSAVNIQIALADWEQTGGPEGAKVRSFACFGDTIFAGTQSGEGGVFVSTDGGESWNTAGLKHYYTGYLAFSGSILYAAGTTQHIFRSDNFGKTWIPVSMGLGESYEIASLAAMGDKIFAGTYSNGVYQSNDSGKTWSSIGFGNEWVYCLAVSDSFLIAGTRGYDGLLRSRSYEKTWPLECSGISDTYIMSLSAQGSKVFAGTSTSGIFISTDNGANWSQTSLSFRNTEILSIASRGDMVFIGTKAGAFRSMDNGLSWVAADSGLPAWPILSLAITSKGVYAGTEGAGVYVSSDSGSHWKPMNTGLMKAMNVTTLLANGNSLYAGTQQAGVFRSMDRGVNWVPVNDGLRDSYVTMLLATDSTLYAGTYPGNLYWSGFNGTPWALQKPALNAGAQVLSLVIQGGRMYAGTGKDGIFFCDRRDSIWTITYSGLPYFIYDLKLVSYGNYLLTGGKRYSIYRSTDSALTWTAIKSEPKPSGINCFAVKGNTIFSGTDSGIYMSTDSGKTWKAGAAQISKQRVYSLAVLDSFVFIGADSGGLFLSADNGKTCSSINTGLPNATITSLAVSGTNLYAGTSDSSVWRRPLEEITGISNFRHMATPLNFDIHVTVKDRDCLRLAFFLSRPDQVTAHLFDLSGRKTETLINKRLGAGAHELIWRSDYLGRGCLILKMKVGPNSITKNVVVYK